MYIRYNTTIVYVSLFCHNKNTVLQISFLQSSFYITYVKYQYSGFFLENITVVQTSPAKWKFCRCRQKVFSIRKNMERHICPLFTHFEVTCQWDMWTSHFRVFTCKDIMLTCLASIWMCQCAMWYCKNYVLLCLKNKRTSQDSILIC
jgi:hypothetical protein